LGRLILKEGISAAFAEFDAKHVYVEAQKQAKGFYEKSGFYQVSDEFMVDGIPHIGMICDITEEEV
ncbi:MAG: GNAT family N-acetyltransferase, partial [Solobacterium sp.]|nr:GNAT family N-acetyltransferase [Solobacterium sp.]